MLRAAFLFIAMLFASAGMAQPLPPGAPAVVITEIMYDLPGTGSDSLEFIELRNPSAVNERSLANYRFLSGIEFAFVGNVLVQPHEFVIVAKDSVAFEIAFGIPAYQWVSGDLDDQGELIVLGNGNTGVDSVEYSTGGLWSVSAAGLGHSLEFCNDTLNNAIPLYWSASNTNTGIQIGGATIFASPGDVCSVGNSIYRHNRPDVSVYPNPNLGVVTISGITEKFDVTVFDLNGKSVYSRYGLSGNTTLDLNTELASGMYMAAIRTNGQRFYRRISIVE
jgi:hypothetical protein